MHDFTYYYNSLGEYGEVQQVSYPVISITGLPFAKPKELVLLETGQKGWVLSLNKNTVDVLLLSQEKVPIGTKVARTDTRLSIPVSHEFLGLTIDPLGQVIGEETSPLTKQYQPLDVAPLGIDVRVKITRPFKTGTTLIDMMVPLGKGQRELIIGDRKTGKTAFLLTALKKQVQEGAVAIYAAIGKKASDIKYIQELLEEEQIEKQVLIIATSSADAASAVYLTPFSAMSVAEYFAQEGRDVVVVLDDLSTHARVYRELSLIAKNFPGRDSYPGDIFYTHARLLERAGNFSHPTKKEVAITALPVIETIEGDLTGYIQTNIMGITDGHIFFDSDIFYNGRRPAVNIQLSVTRAGRQTQSQMNRDITRELTAFLTLYERMQNLSHFGSELTDNVKGILAKGDNISTFFNQPHMSIIDEEVQLVLFGLLWLGIIDKSDKIADIRTQLQQAYMNKKTRDLFHLITTATSFNDMLKKLTDNKEDVLSLWRKSIN